ncbi:MAG: lysophospholipase [Pseudomonadota bacterium]
MDDVHTIQLTARDGTTLMGRHWEAQHAFATVALVHGFGEHCGRYQPWVQHLTARGIQVVAIDLRGHGRSDGPRGVINGYDDFRADLDALLTRAKELHAPLSGPLILMGHSMGGGIVLDYGLQEEPGVDGIIASAPLIALAEPPPSILQIIVRGLAKLFPRLALKQPIDGSKISTMPAEQSTYVDDALNHGSMGVKTVVDLIDTGRALMDKAGHWSIPLLIYHSDQDQLTDFETSHDFAALARAEFHSFTNVEHEMHNDTSRAAVYALVDGFIDRIAGRD